MVGDKEEIKEGVIHMASTRGRRNGKKSVGDATKAFCERDAAYFLPTPKYRPRTSATIQMIATEW